LQAGQTQSWQCPLSPVLLSQADWPPESQVPVARWGQDGVQEVEPNWLLSSLDDHVTVPVGRKAETVAVQEVD